MTQLGIETPLIDIVRQKHLYSFVPSVCTFHSMFVVLERLRMIPQNSSCCGCDGAVDMHNLSLEAKHLFNESSLLGKLSKSGSTLSDD